MKQCDQPIKSIYSKPRTLRRIKFRSDGAAPPFRTPPPKKNIQRFRFTDPQRAADSAATSAPSGGRKTKRTINKFEI